MAAASPHDLAEGHFRIYLQGASGPSGANLLGRFCHADPALQVEVEQHLRAEEALRPAAVFAEIAYLPQGRMGNVILRPVLRGYEIPYLGRSGAPPERQIPVTDLFVSVSQDRVVLRSKRLDCEVLPALRAAAAPALCDGRLWKIEIGTYERPALGRRGISFPPITSGTGGATCSRLCEAFSLTGT